MSITDLEKIDGIGLDKNNSTRLNLMIADNLDWQHTDIHLEILSDKLNNYYHYIKSGQYLTHYQKINEFMIIIYFQHQLNSQAKMYLQNVSEKLSKENIFIQLKIDE